MEMLEYIGTENYLWGLDIVPNRCDSCQFFLCDFLGPKCSATPKSYATELYNWKRLSEELKTGITYKHLIDTQLLFSEWWILTIA